MEVSDQLHTPSALHQGNSRAIEKLVVVHHVSSHFYRAWMFITKSS